jgi:hypothetical protein
VLSLSFLISGCLPPVKTQEWKNFSNSPTSDRYEFNGCSKYQGNDYIMCLSKKARQFDNYSICDKLNNISDYTDCRIYYCVNYDWCGGRNGCFWGEMSGCLQHIVRDTHEFRVCSYDTVDTYYECISAYARFTLNSSICDILKTQYEKNYCFKEVGKYDGGITCQKIVNNTEYLSLCYNTAAEISNNPVLCNNLSTDYFTSRDECIIDVAVQNLDENICKEIINTTIPRDFDLGIGFDTRNASLIDACIYQVTRLKNDPNVVSYIQESKQPYQNGSFPQWG